MKQANLLIGLTISWIISATNHGYGQQLFPAEGAIVNCTNVYFQDSLQQGAKQYTLCLYRDSVSALHRDRPVKCETNKIPSFWLGGLDWATTYYWSLAWHNATGRKEGRVHSFSTQTIVYQGFDEIRLDIKTNKKEKHAGGYIAIDYTRSVYDRNGKLVWTLPMVPGAVGEGTQVRDLKMTKDGTFTFLTIPNAIEMDWQGRVLWKAPQPFVYKGDTVVYHHQLTKTKRNTYMVMGDRLVWRHIPGGLPDDDLANEMKLKTENGKLYKKVLVAVMLEFNKEGKLVWSWDADLYLNDEDLIYKRNRRNFPNMSSHANAFGLNDDETKVYVGFRELSRIVRINKADGKVESSFGERYPSGEALYAHGLFLNQHDANVTKRNSILLLNNNGALSREGVSSVLEIRDKMAPGDSSLIWRFDLNFDTLSSGKTMNGGNVNEIDGGNLLVCAGALNRIFEVTKKKEIVWDAFLWAKGKGDTLWQEMQQYRCGFLKELPLTSVFISLRPLKKLPGGMQGEIKMTHTGSRSSTWLIEAFDSADKLISSQKTPLLKKDQVYNAVIGWKTPNKVRYLIVRNEAGTFIQKVNVY